MSQRDESDSGEWEPLDEPTHTRAGWWLVALLVGVMGFVLLVAVLRRL